MQVRLPVDGSLVVLRQPAGAEDILLAEAVALDMRLGVQLLSAITTDLAGSAVDILSLPVTDAEVLLLRLRQWLLGDTIRSDVRCGAEGCGKRVDIGFRVADYLAHHAPQPALDATPPAEGPWWSLADSGVRFRVPLVADHIAATGATAREEALRRRCVRASDLSPEEAARVDAALEAIAPSLFSELTGACPECGAAVVAMFDPVAYVLRELSRRAASVYEEVHLLASRYHWSESEILALPRGRRVRYAELLQGARG